MADDRGDIVPRLLTPGVTCWKQVPSRRFSLLVDARDYYAALAAVLSQARQHIMICGWDFDSSICLDPEAAGCLTLGETLRQRIEAVPDLHVYLLVWRGSIFYGDSAEFPNLYGARWRDHERIHVVYDDCHPFGGSHHQKIVCLDDNLAFAGGIDLTRKRWDDTSHSRDRCHRSTGESYSPVHDEQAVFDGQAAQAIAELFRQRWHCNTGESLRPLPLQRSFWPSGVRPAMRDARLGVLRTQPAYGEQVEAREIEAYNLAALRAARRVVYIEAQYFALPEIAEVLTASLERDHGPEIIIVANRRSSGLIEHYVMAQKRDFLFARMRRADRHGRLRLYHPVSVEEAEYEIHVHSTLMIIDDCWLRVGSSNLNGRSMGLDSECDVVLEAETEAAGNAIVQLRTRLLAEHLGVSPARLAATLAATRSLIRAVDRLNLGPRRLRSYTDEPVRETIPFGESLLDPPRPLDFDYLWNTMVGPRSESRAE